MTEDEITLGRLKASLLQAMRRNHPQGVRVTMEGFVAAAELVKEDQAQVYEIAGQLFIRQQV